MRDKVFLDSNVILYSYSKTEVDKNREYWVRYWELLYLSLITIQFL